MKKVSKRFGVGRDETESTRFGDTLGGQQGHLAVDCGHECRAEHNDDAVALVLVQTG